MNSHIREKLERAENKFEVFFPEALTDFICGLSSNEVTLGGETWYIGSVTDDTDDPYDNYVVHHSVMFNNEWNLTGLVFADNGVGDYLLVLPNEWGEHILVMMHETGEIRLYASSIQELRSRTDGNHHLPTHCIYKLDDDNNVLCFDVNGVDITTRDFIADYELRSHLDNLIDDDATEKTSEIILGLEKLTTRADKLHQIWALNKLSDIYLRGFGPIASDLEKALAFNLRAIDLNSHLAYSNRAACYFFGLGVTKDIHKALEFASKANDLSKANAFASTMSDKPGGGMYEHLVEMITKEISKNY